MQNIELNYYAINPAFSAFMFGSLLIAFTLSIMLMRNVALSAYFSGTFIAICDPRFTFGYNIFNTNFSVFIIYFWAVATGLWHISSIGKYGRNLIYQYVSHNKIMTLWLAAVLISVISMPNGMATTIRYSFLIFAPYFLLIPHAIAWTEAEKNGIKAKTSFLYGLQSGIAIYVILTNIYAPGEFSEALGDTSVNATIISILCSYGLFSSIYLLHQADRPLEKILNLLLIFLFIVSEINTISRGSIIATLVVSPVLLFLIYRKRLTNNAAYLVFYTLAMTFYALFSRTIFDFVFEKRQTIVSGGIIESLSGMFINDRYEKILDVVNFKAISLADLLIGHGLGQSSEISETIKVRRIESFWFESIYEIGIIGSIILISALVMNVFSIYYSKKLEITPYRFLYLTIFLYVLLLSPSSFGWFLHGNPGFLYVSFMILGCSRPLTISTRRQCDPKAIFDYSSSYAHKLK